MRRLLLLIPAIGLLSLCFSCRDNREGFVPSLPVGEYVPTMTTIDVNTFISDSGYTRYHIIADIWRMYEDAPDPFWKFPDGLFLEQYDEEQQPVANVVCDSATYFSRRRLWQLDGHVVMVNTDRDSFLTEQLFWDQTRQKVYSDSFIHIVRSDRIIEGYGFESNQNMTAYTVNRPTGIIPVNRPEPSENIDEPADTTNPVDDSGDVRPVRRSPAPVRASRRNAAADTLPLKPETFN